MLCCNMLCKQIKIKIMASTLFGGSGGAIYMKQDACTGVHSACRREENGLNLDICVLRPLRLRRLRLRQGQMQGFLGLKVGGGS